MHVLLTNSNFQRFKKKFEIKHLTRKKLTHTAILMHQKGVPLDGFCVFFAAGTDNITLLEYFLDAGATISRLDFLTTKNEAILNLLREHSPWF